MKSHFDGVDPILCPRDPKTGEPLPPRSQPGYYPGFSTLSQGAFWDTATRAVVDKRVKHPPEPKFFAAEAWTFWTTVFAHLIPQTDRIPERQIPIVATLDHRLANDQTAGYRYETMPPDRVVYEIGIEAIDREAQHRYRGKFLVLPYLEQDLVLKAIHDGKPEAAQEIWKHMSVHRFWQMIMGDAIDAYYAHPWAWDEIGFGGPAYPRAYTRLERGEPEPWEVEEQRYVWLAPANSASAEVDSSPSHHAESGQHSLPVRSSKGARR
ncbi:gluconate 2-dehydrogenase subunit 3 family protein [Acidicapsa dinghuensis]|uniref:Gluconate 2-dehydrogenase subunit 3 family protein n=1 Tax=Acidicapsa dinghuensis TaxID=2218256 RepID=A0ABW1EEQ7_9BACT|nr:gluconate 2-dehydrogenase subunit 3 family protein [Acidicapsa dinghuensis]